MFKYARRITSPYVKAVQSGYRDLRRWLRDNSPVWLSPYVDGAFDRFDLFIVDHGVVRAIYPNRHRLTRNVWRSSQPAPHDIALFARNGIRTIINLRGRRDCGSYRLERIWCARYGIRLIDFPAKSRQAPDAAFFRDAKALFENVDYPMLMHCKSGADRVGMMSALYLMLVEARSADEALRQLSLRHGHIRQGQTGVLDAVLEAYIQRNGRAPISFLDWTETEYQPAMLTAKFAARSWANMLVDVLLRRE
jgi:protein tyrosine phosphatase (PTP) superfamily phosphohydrolase (DUF442 family)